MKPTFRLILVLLLGLTGCAGAPDVTATPTLPASTLPSPSATPQPIPPEPQASLLEIINLVEAHDLPGKNWSPAMLEMALYPGGEVWAKEASTALILFLNRQGVLRVAPNTVFTLEQPDPQALKIRLDSGQIWVTIEGMTEGESFEVETPNATASVRGTRFSVRVDKNGKTVVSVIKGIVEVRSSQGTTTLEQKGQVEVAPDGVLTGPGPLQYQEIIPWGLAGGTHLETIVPVNQMVETIEINGLAKEGVWSADGSLFSYNVYIPPDSIASQKFYNLQQNAEFIPANLPDYLYEIFYNPAKDGMAWEQNGVPGQEICTARNDGSQPACFGSDQSGVKFRYPRWAPDGNKLLFLVQGSQSTKLAIAEPDGKNLTILNTPETQQLRRHTWSPDGSLIAFASPESQDYNATGAVWVMQSNGTAPQKIFEGLQYAGTIDPLSWSPDGRWLALPGPDGLYLVSTDGSQSSPLPGLGAGGYYSLTWAKTPSGWPLVFKYSNPETKTGGMFYVLDETSSPQELMAYTSWGPIYSPDGRLAAFGSIQNLGNSENPLYKSTIYFYSLIPY